MEFPSILIRMEDLFVELSVMVGSGSIPTKMVIWYV